MIFIYVIAILILLYLLVSSIVLSEKYVLKIVYRTVNQQNVTEDQISTLVDCLSMIVDHPQMINYNVTGNVDIINELYHALMCRDKEEIKQRVNNILK